MRVSKHLLEPYSEPYGDLQDTMGSYEYVPMIGNTEDDNAVHQAFAENSLRDFDSKNLN